MTTAAILLVLICVLGLFDIVFFHRHHANLTQRPECRTEAWVHIARGVIYTLQLVVVANVAFYGAWYAALVVLYVLDVTIAWVDVWIEPDARRSQGGLPRGEYFMHVVLSVLVGAYLYAVFQATWGWMDHPSQIAWRQNVPPLLQGLLNVMALGCLLNTLYEALELMTSGLDRPKPLHIRARIPAKLDDLWHFTQNHRLHPEWDHRFSHIEMFSEQIKTGTEMRYQKKFLGLTIQGRGRYKLHRPMRQSTFEFRSDDVRSIIKKGVGLWLYTDNGDGTIDFFTAYTYDVRWGVVGKLIDRWLFRPLILRETEKSFERLERMFRAQQLSSQDQPLQGRGTRSTTDALPA